jgi:hypothetical protein
MFGRSAIPGGMRSYGKGRSRRAVESLPRSLVFTSNSGFPSRPSRQRVVKIGVIGGADQAVERGTGAIETWFASVQLLVGFFGRIEANSVEG